MRVLIQYICGGAEITHISQNLEDAADPQNTLWETQQHCAAVQSESCAVEATREGTEPGCSACAERVAEM